MLTPISKPKALTLFCTLCLWACGPVDSPTDASVKLDGSVASDAGVTADAGSGGLGADAGFGGPALEIANVPHGSACRRASVIAPILPDEAGHWVATRLVPPSYPFRVEQLEYSLGGGPRAAAACRTELAHRVRVYLMPATQTLEDGGTAATRPPSAPSAAGLTRELSVANTASGVDSLGFDGGIRGRTSRVALTSPVTLTAGQVIFVSIEVVGAYEGLPDGGLNVPTDGGGYLSDGGLAPNVSLCIDACRIGFDGGAAPLAGVDAWSNSAVEPYPWADTVADFGFPFLLSVRAIGRAQ